MMATGAGAPLLPGCQTHDTVKANTSSNYPGNMKLSYMEVIKVINNPFKL